MAFSFSWPLKHPQVEAELHLPLQLDISILDHQGEGEGPLAHNSRNQVLLSTACPTSPASDQTKGGGRSGVQKKPRFGAESERFNLTEIQFTSKLSQKNPKEV